MKIRGFLEDPAAEATQDSLRLFTYVIWLRHPTQSLGQGYHLLPEADLISTRFGCFVHNQKVRIITISQSIYGPKK